MVLYGVFCLILAASFSVEVDGHGYMVNPPNRASLWRIDSTQPVNYDDNAYYCGGAYVQHYVNGGNCGVCGDDFRNPVPRSNENGGTFGNGVIVANYTAGSVITVTSLLTSNHLGGLYFQICKLEDASAPETEECFQDLSLADGTTHHEVSALENTIEVKIELPNDLVCERCVLRWHYKAGNSWGVCDDGTQKMGCGSQETFRSCADVRIVAGDSSQPSSPVDTGDESPPEVAGDSSQPISPVDTGDESPPEVAAENSIVKISDDSSADADVTDQPCIINPYYNAHVRRR